MNHLQLAILREISGLPTEIQVVPFGYHETDKGPFLLDGAGAAMVMENFEGRKNDMVIDYEHQTLYGGEAPAAGWIKQLVNRGEDGIWAVVEWTKRAAEYLKNREYRYLSPVFLKTMNEGRVVKLLNAALTNTPAIDGMVPMVNKQTNKKEEPDMKFLEQLIALMAMKAGATEEQVLDAVKALQGVAVAHKDTLEALGLKPEATADEVKTAVMAMKEKPGGDAVVVAHKDVLDALGLKPEATLSEVKGTVLAMKQGSESAGDLAQRVAALEGQLADGTAESLVAQAMKDGKVTPAQRDWALAYAKEDPKGFEAFAAKAPVVVQPGEVAGGPGPSAATAVSDDVQTSVNKSLGVDDEMYKQHGPQTKAPA